MANPCSNDRFISLSVLVEALGTGKSRFVASPVRGRIVRVQYAVDVAVDGDNIMTLELSGVACTDAAKTLTTAHVAGTCLTQEVVNLNEVNVGTPIECITDGGGAVGQVRVTITIEQD